jgi:hypothetical protein
MALWRAAQEGGQECETLPPAGSANSAVRLAGWTVMHASADVFLALTDDDRIAVVGLTADGRHVAAFLTPGPVDALDATIIRAGVRERSRG